MDRPTYRAKRDNVCLPNGLTFPAGAEFVWTGWPKFPADEIEPANEAGARMLAYYATHRLEAFLPGSPHDADLGKIYLPAVLIDPRTTALHGLPREEFPGMPRYSTRFHQTISGRQFKRGDEFAFVAWPTPSTGLAPINEEAQRVVAYLETFAGHPRLPQSPWCDFERALVLPELVPVTKQVFARDLSGGRRNSWDDEINKRRIAAAQAALREAAKTGLF